MKHKRMITPIEKDNTRKQDVSLIYTYLSFSDGYTTKEVDFVWHMYKKALRIKDNLILPEFTITGTHATVCNAAYYTGITICLIIDFIPDYVSCIIH